jgi:3,4-dihydroxy-2-butanone 4-phosphate synthase
MYILVDAEDRENEGDVIYGLTVSGWRPFRSS